MVEKIRFEKKNLRFEKFRGMAFKWWSGHSLTPQIQKMKDPALRDRIKAEQDEANTLFTQWAVPFEIASLVLLVALIGAIVLSRGVGGR